MYSKCSFRGTLSSAYKVVECERKNVHFQIRCNTICSHECYKTLSSGELRLLRLTAAMGLWRAAEQRQQQQV